MAEKTAQEIFDEMIAHVNSEKSAYNAESI